MEVLKPPKSGVQQAMQHSEEGGGGHLRNAGIQENAFLEKNKSL
jgi:hypothetical protein